MNFCGCSRARENNWDRICWTPRILTVTRVLSFILFWWQEMRRPVEWNWHPDLAISRCNPSLNRMSIRGGFSSDMSQADPLTPNWHSRLAIHSAIHPFFRLSSNPHYLAKGWVTCTVAYLELSTMASLDSSSILFCLNINHFTG